MSQVLLCSARPLSLFWKPHQVTRKLAHHKKSWCCRCSKVATWYSYSITIAHERPATNYNYHYYYYYYILLLLLELELQFLILLLALLLYYCCSFTRGSSRSSSSRTSSICVGFIRFYYISVTILFYCCFNLVATFCPCPGDLTTGIIRCSEDCKKIST